MTKYYDPEDLTSEMPDFWYALELLDSGKAVNVHDDPNLADWWAHIKEGDNGRIVALTFLPTSDDRIEAHLASRGSMGLTNEHSTRWFFNEVESDVCARIAELKALGPIQEPYFG